MAITYKLEDDIDYILEEKNKSFLALRKVAWGEHDGKLDIRKWFVNQDNGDDIPGKGVQLTQDAASELAIALLEENCGNTKQIIRTIKHRDNFQSDLKIALETDEDPKEESEDNDEELYDAEALLD